MRAEIFPKCCGAGVLVIEHLTGKGKEEDKKLLRSWIDYIRRNGYYMYDFPQEYQGKSGDPKSSIAAIGGPGDRKPESGRSWGICLAITNPGQGEAAALLEEFGFKLLMDTHNPVYGKIPPGTEGTHKIKLWGLDMNLITDDIINGTAEYPKTPKPSTDQP
jgi:hypothetical protein